MADANKRSTGMGARCEHNEKLYSERSRHMVVGVVCAVYASVRYTHIHGKGVSAAGDDVLIRNAPHDCLVREAPDKWQVDTHHQRKLFGRSNHSVGTALGRLRCPAKLTVCFYQYESSMSSRAHHM